MTFRIYKIICFAFVVVILTNCKILKTVKVLKKGSVAQKTFREEIPFESRAGLIIVKVIIQGREFQFIYDSGATNAVTKEVAELLHLKPVVDQTAEDSEGKTGGIQFAVIDSIKMGKLNFLNTGAAIIDLKKVPELVCLGVDGLIGANLMRKACWQIDYKKKILVAASSMDSLHISKSASSFDFSPVISGTPMVEVKVNGVLSKDNVFDTGSSGDIVLPGSTLKKLVIKNPSLLFVRGQGSNSAGLYGRGNDTSYIALIDTVRMGNLFLQDHVIEFKRSHSGNLGSAFFKDYIVTMNWKQKKIWFEPQPNFENKAWETFGFTANSQDKKMIVSFLFDGSPAVEAGMKQSDQIISANGKSYVNLADADYCEMIANLSPWKKESRLSLIIKPADGNAEKMISLEKRNILKK